MSLLGPTQNDVSDHPTTLHFHFNRISLSERRQAKQTHKIAMEDLDLDDLGDLDDLENLECDWENSFEHSLENFAYDPPAGDSHQNGTYTSSGAAASQQLGIDPSASTPPQDSTSSNDAAQIRLDRERDGRCADCGAQTHEIQMDPSGNGRAVKIPLSVTGEVHRGRCLFCHPLPQNHRASTGSSSRQASQGRNKRQMDPAPTLDDLHELARNGRFEHANDTHEYNRLASSASVSSHTSNQSSYSQHSAPVNWGGNGGQPSQYQQQLLMQQQQIRNGFSQEIMDQYNQIQRQQQYADDAGSVYSQSSHASQASFHSNQSHQSHATYNSFMQHGQQHYGGLNNSINSQGQDFNPIIENILVQMQDDSLNFESVVHAMSQFPSHALIQENGCAILWVQTYNAEICRALTNVGGVNTILEAMRNHPHVARLQRAACEALRNMCGLPLNRQILLSQGGIAILVETMQRHADDAQIQRSGCTALASVAEGGMEYKIGVAESGGILAVMKAVESHPENDLVLRSAYQALRMLGYNPGAGGY